MPNNVVKLPKDRQRSAGRDAAIEAALDELRPFLREYMAKQGVEFDRMKADAFHCFNKAAHAHGDADASAALNPKTDYTRFKCFTCGVEGDIFEACRLIEGRSIEGRDFIDTARHLANMFNVPFPEKGTGTVRNVSADEPVKEKTNEYIYTTETGEVIYKVERFVLKQFGKPVLDDLKKPKKEFRPLVRKDNGWVVGYGDVQRVLYHLPEVKAAIKAGETIFFVEGEKCADIIREKLQLTATCIAGGANAWIKPHKVNYLLALADAKVVILTDNDSAGRKFGEQVAADVAPLVESVKLVELPGLPEKGDIEQWILLRPDDYKEKLLSILDYWPVLGKESKGKENTGPVYIMNGRYYRHDDKHGDRPISDFTIHPLCEVIPDDSNIFSRQFNVQVKPVGHQPIELTITLDAFLNRMKFKTTFPHWFLCFTGNDDDVTAIKGLFGQEAHEVKRGVKHVGFHQGSDGRELFVSESKTIDVDGAESNDVVLMKGEQQITTSILDMTTLDASGLATIIKPLFAFNSLDKCVTILGWVGNCFLREKLYQAGIKCPHLFIYGEAGSGKSQTVESIIMPLFCTEARFAAGQLTDFGAARLSASSNTIPFIIDEYKPFAIGEARVKRISELMRQTFERTVIVRGRQDLSTTSYQYRAPICLVGEEGTDETANKERGLELLFSKKALHEENHGDSFYTLRAHTEELQSMGRSLLTAALKANVYAAEMWYRTALSALKPKIKAKAPGMPERVASAAAGCLAGLYLFNDMLLDLGTTIEEATGLSFGTMEDSLLSAVIINIMDNHETTRSAVDNILEVMDRMAARGLYQDGVHYQVVNDGLELALDIAGMYDEFKKYRREHDITCESLEQNQFTKQLKQKDYYKGYRTVRFKNGGSKPKMAHILDVTSTVFSISLAKLTEGM